MDMDMSQQTLTRLHTEKNNECSKHTETAREKKIQNERKKERKRASYTLLNDCFCINAMNKNNRK